jgi:hypothetical protein
MISRICIRISFNLPLIFLTCTRYPRAVVMVDILRNYSILFHDLVVCHLHMRLMACGASCGRNTWYYPTTTGASCTKGESTLTCRYVGRNQSGQRNMYISPRKSKDGERVNQKLEIRPFKAWRRWPTVALQAHTERPTPSGTSRRRPSA